MSKLRLQGLKENEATHRKKGESRLEVAKGVGKRIERCPLCGSHEWIGEVKDYLLHHRCKRCGFESKEMVGD